MLVGHRGPIYAAVFSRDGQRVVSGAADATIRIWKVEAGALERILLGHRGTVWSLALSPDGKTLASGSWDKDLRLWRFPQGKLLSRLQGHREVVSAVAFAPDGRRVYSCSRDRTARAWRVIGRRPRGRRRGDEGHRGGVLAVAVSPDGATIASGGQDGVLRLWSARSGRQLAALEGHEGAVQAALFVGSSLLASGGQDGKLRLWSITSRKTIRVLHGHRGAIWALARLPMGDKRKRVLVSAGADRTIRVWDAREGALIRVLHAHRGAVMALAVMAGGEIWASGGADRAVRLWSREGAPLAVLRGHQDTVTGLAFAKGELISTALDGRVQRWRLPPPGATSRPREVDLAADPAAARLLFDLGRGRAYSLAVSPDGRRVALPSSDGVLRLLDLVGGRPQLLRGHTAEVNVAAFSPSGDRLVSGADDRSLRLWRVASGQPYWRASALLPCAAAIDHELCATSGPRIHTHRGWRWLRSGQRAAAPRSLPWRRALAEARLARLSPSGGHLCQLTFGGRLKVWQRTPGAGSNAAQLRFDGPRPAIREILAVPGGCVARSDAGAVERLER